MLRENGREGSRKHSLSLPLSPSENEKGLIKAASCGARRNWVSVWPPGGSGKTYRVATSTYTLVSSPSPESLTITSAPLEKEVAHCKSLSKSSLAWNGLPSVCWWISSRLSGGTSCCNCENHCELFFNVDEESNVVNWKPCRRGV